MGIKYISTTCDVDTCNAHAHGRSSDSRADASLVHFDLKKIGCGRAATLDQVPPASCAMPGSNEERCAQVKALKGLAKSCGVPGPTCYSCI